MGRTDLGAQAGLHTLANRGVTCDGMTHNAPIIQEATKGSKTAGGSESEPSRPESVGERAAVSIAFLFF